MRTRLLAAVAVLAAALLAPSAAFAAPTLLTPGPGPVLTHTSPIGFTWSDAVTEVSFRIVSGDPDINGNCPALPAPWHDVSGLLPNSPRAYSYPASVDGTACYYVEADDGVGPLTESAPVRMTYDSTAVSVTAPAASAVVHGASVTVSANATDTGGTGVTSVDFWAQGSGAPIAIGSTGTPSGISYSVPWDTTGGVPDGLYTVWAVANDAMGQTTSAVVGSVRVDNNAPAVSVTAPAASSVVHGASVTVSATATDPVGGSGVSRVDFFAQGSGAPIAIGSDTTGSGTTYSVPWDTTAFGVSPDGLYAVWAVAVDGATLQTTSTFIANVRVDNTPPDVSLTAPAASTIVHGASVTVSATATDPAGGSGVSRVDFLAQGAGVPIAIGSDTTASGTSYSVPWDTTSGAPDGLYTVWAVAVDGATLQTTSTVVANVRVDNNPPAVSVTAPTASSIVHGASVTVSATATDPVGGSGVTGVDFFAQGSGAPFLIGSDSTGPYSIQWDTTAGVADGLYTVWAVATDGATLSTTSAVIGSVRVDNTAPTGSLTAPTAGALLHGAVNGLTATAADAGGVTSVTFERSPDGITWTPIFVDSSFPYAANWNTTGLDGAYFLHVVVADGAGHTTPTAPVAVSVDNTPPTVTLGGIANNAEVSGTVPLSATAADTGGSGMDSVQFGRRPYPGSGSYVDIGGPVTTEPYNRSFDTTTGGLLDGYYEIRALATDLATNQQGSSVTNVLVDNHAPLAPVAPTGLSPVSATPTISFNGSADVTSNGVQSGVDHYDVYRDGVKVNAAPIPDAGAGPYTWSDVAGQSLNPPSGTPPHTYSYTVRAVDGAGNRSVLSGPHLIVLDATAASAPTAVAALASPTNQLPQVSWAAPAAAPFTVDHYNVYRNSGGSPVGVVVAPATTFTDAKASLDAAGGDGSYTYQVVAAASDGTTVGVASGAVTVVYDTTAPAAPAGVTANAALDGSIGITWGAASDGSGSGIARYVVRRSLTSVPPVAVSDGDATCQGAVTSCTDATTLNGKLYSYAVFAVDRAGNTSLAGVTPGVTARDQLPPGVPKGLSATPGDASVTLKWAAAGTDDDVAGYVLVAKPGAQPPANETDGTRVCAAIVATSTACTATGLTNGATYTFGLFALDEALNRSLPAIVSAAPNGKVTDTKAPAAVSKLKATVSGHTVTLTWKNPADHDFDHVEITAGDRKPASLKAAKRVYSGKGTKTTTTVAAGQSRWFVVVAYDVAGNASQPASVHVTIAAPSAFGPAPSAKVHGPVKLSWPVAKGAQYYNVQVYAGKQRIFVSWPTGRALQLPRGKLKRGIKYTWYVWPGLGAKSKARYGKLIGRNAFTFAG